MENFNSFSGAEKAAQSFFKKLFNYTNGVGVEFASGLFIEFYSKDDPGNDVTFSCTIEDGYLRYCANGGDLTTVKA